MDIGLWRSGLATWLDSKMVVDSWELRNPTEYGKLNAFIPPLQSINFNDDEVGRAFAVQDFYLTYRYRGDILYVDLPLGVLEQRYVTLCRRLVREFKAIAPIESLELLPAKDAIQVSEYGDSKADWLITMVISAQISWVPSPTQLPAEVISDPIPEPPIIIQTITQGLYAEKLTSTDHLEPTTRDKYGELQLQRLPQ
jgi:hypothetical protein